MYAQKVFPSISFLNNEICWVFRLEGRSVPITADIYFHSPLLEKSSYYVIDVYSI